MTRGGAGAGGEQEEEEETHSGLSKLIGSRASTQVSALHSVTAALPRSPPTLLATSVPPRSAEAISVLPNANSEASRAGAQCGLLAFVPWDVRTRALLSSGGTTRGGPSPLGELFIPEEV